MIFAPSDDFRDEFRAAQPQIELFSLCKGYAWRLIRFRINH
jgi:hypothetical protein